MAKSKELAMPQRLIFTGKQQLALSPISPKPLATDEIRARGICSLMSTGTENIVYNRLFDPGTHWDEWAKYPFTPGYSWIGEIVETGAEVPDFKPGQRIAARLPHAEEHTTNRMDRIIPIPDNVPTDEAAWFALAKIAYTGAVSGEIRLGSRVLVIGGGPIGQMALRWARVCGARRTVLVDPLPLRQEMATRGGANAVIGQRIDAVIDDMPAHFGGELPDIVIDTTGVAAVFESALECCRPRGTVVVLGDTGSPASQHLSPRVIVHGIRIVGAHDGLFETRPAVELFFDYLQDQRFNTSGMITHRVDFQDAQSAYDLANRERENTMGILFEY